MNYIQLQLINNGKIIKIIANNVLGMLNKRQNVQIQKTNLMFMVC